MSSKNVQAHALSRKDRRVVPTGWKFKVGAVVAGGLGAVMFGGGVFAAWVPTTNISSGGYNAATLNVTLLDTNNTTFTTGVSNLLPGDYLNRYADLTNTGTVAQTFNGMVAGSGTLAGVVSVAVDNCSVAWSAGGTCGGTTTALKTSTLSSTNPTFNTTSLAVNGVAHLRFKFVVDTNAATTYQGTTSSQVVTVTGTATSAGGQDRTNG